MVRLFHVRHVAIDHQYVWGDEVALVVSVERCKNNKLFGAGHLDAIVNSALAWRSLSANWQAAPAP